MRLTIAVLILAGAAQLGAVTVVQARSNSTDSPFTPFVFQDTGLFVGTQAAVESGPLAGSWGSLDAKSYVKSDPLFGPALGVYSSALAVLGNAVAYSEASWNTGITVTGAANTQVTFSFGIHLSDSAFVTPNGPTGGGDAKVQLTGKIDTLNLSIVDEVSPPFFLPPVNRTIWGTATFTVGDRINIGADLRADASALAAQAIADGYSTGLVALQVLTPGGGYTADDGWVFATSFDTAAPEPGTFALAGFACLFVLAGARRSRGSIFRRSAG